MHQLAKKCNPGALTHRYPVARVLKRPHTCSMIGFGFVLLAIECVFSIFFGMVFWHFWSRSAMKRPTAIRATLIYVSGCILFLLLTFLLPL